MKIDDPTACMSRFYTNVKNEIPKSWDSVFDKSRFTSIEKVGTIWEIKSDWIIDVVAYA